MAIKESGNSQKSGNSQEKSVKVRRKSGEKKEKNQEKVSRAGKMQAIIKKQLNGDCVNTIGGMLTAMF